MKRKETTDEAIAKVGRLLTASRKSAESSERTLIRAKDRDFLAAKSIFERFNMSAKGYAKNAVISRARSITRQDNSPGLTFRKFSSDEQCKNIKAAAKRFSINPESITANGFFAPVPKNSTNIRTDATKDKIIISYDKDGFRHRRVAVSVPHKQIPKEDKSKRQFIRANILQAFKPIDYEIVSWAESIYGWMTQFNKGEEVPEFGKNGAASSLDYSQFDDAIFNPDTGAMEMPTRKAPPRVFIIEYKKEK